MCLIGIGGGLTVASQRRHRLLEYPLLQLQQGAQYAHT